MYYITKWKKVKNMLALLYITDKWDTWIDVLRLHAALR
jgi:hypothetical protein